MALPDGSPAVFTYVDHPGFVSVVPLTAGGQVVLIRSYRYTVDELVLEVPAGGFGAPEAGESSVDPLAVARHELLEETGHEAERFEAVTQYWSGDRAQPLPRLRDARPGRPARGGAAARADRAHRGGADSGRPGLGDGP